MITSKYYKGMTTDELIKALRSEKLDGGNPLTWVHLICEAADKLEHYRDMSCVGCVDEKDGIGCYQCARCYKDKYREKQKDWA